jgi:hypothetical protein
VGHELAGMRSYTFVIRAEGGKLVVEPATVFE